ncbi:hypothetical protein CRYO30217_01117 [Parvicella tangerina]|uniref:Uncharacterized protein n=1 Tax=Parvicella tangerina TaxID=2829795 RepID=A0A916JLE6_9FLAO|nr:hypothetical protein CRYO30217_01117 [Parvicella tangerina]
MIYTLKSGIEMLDYIRTIFKKLFLKNRIMFSDQEIINFKNQFNHIQTRLNVVSGQVNK